MSPRRPRLGVRAKLMLAASMLCAVPVLAYLSAREVRGFLLRGQESAQLLAARAIATVLHNRDDLFHPTFGLPFPLTDEQQVRAALLDAPVQIDGNPLDWGDVAAGPQVFGEDHVLQSQVPYDPADVQLRLLLGLRGGFIYAFATVRDDRVLFRSHRYLRLDACDQLRLYVVNADGERIRYALLADRAGTGTAYKVDDTWGTALDGQPERNILSEWRTTDDGYTVEFRFPERMLGRDARLAFLVADVDEPGDRTVETLIGTVRHPRVDALNRLFVQSDEIARILSGLDRPDARIWVVDTQQRVRALTGKLGPEEDRAPPAAASAQRDSLVAQALAGREGVSRTQDAQGRRILAAAYPVWSGDSPLGAVVVEQTEDRALVLQERTMQHLLVGTLTVFALVMLALLLFATRLVMRIRQLRNALDDAIDAHGRVRLDRLPPGAAASDEIGDLARAFAGMLQRLAGYMHFLERMPRTLKHEMQNPLNTVSTSLENLAAEVPSARDTPYLAAGQRGVQRLAGIVSSLTEAANLEDALRAETRAPVDLHALLSEYVRGMAAGHPDRRIAFRSKIAAAPVEASDIMLEQLLDKLLDNALDFTPADGRITVELGLADGYAHISVANEGPPLPDGPPEQLFDSLVSARAPGGDGQPHLGMGLYVVRLIAEHHGGRVHAANRNGGVAFTVHLPLARAQTSASANLREDPT